MNNIIKNQVGLISELFNSTSDVGIILGENQNLDSVAAALGLFLTLKSSGKSVQIVSKKVPQVEVSNLFGVDKIGQTFGGVSKIVTISIPYHEEIEKVSYNIEGDKLFVNLFAEEQGINLDESQIEYIRKGSNPSVVVTIGVPDERELIAFVDPTTTKTMHIDNNSMNALTGDVLLVDSSFSSLSEIVAEVIREANLGVDHDGFQNLMTGIDYATKSFTSPATTGFAFEAAGFLMQNGAKRPERRMEVHSRPQNTDNTNDRQDRNRDRGRDRNDRRDKNDSAAGRQGDRNRNFPQDHLLTQRPPRNSQQRNQDQRGRNDDQRSQQSSNRNQSQNDPQSNQNPTFNQGQIVQDDSQYSSQPQNDISDVTFGQHSLNDSAAQVADTDLNQAPAPYQDPRVNPNLPAGGPTPREAQDMDMPNEYVDENSTAEGATTAEIPDDWFLPKVFKGSKKPNN